jgi:hypothetical protein
VNEHQDNEECKIAKKALWTRTEAHTSTVIPSYSRRLVVVMGRDFRLEK